MFVVRVVCGSIYGFSCVCFLIADLFIVSFGLIRFVKWFVDLGGGVVFCLGRFCLCWGLCSINGAVVFVVFRWEWWVVYKYSVLGFVRKRRGLLLRAMVFGVVSLFF